MTDTPNIRAALRRLIELEDDKGPAPAIANAWTDAIAAARAALAQPVADGEGVEVSVSDALIKAECALSDIAEGEPEPNSDSADLLEWSEQRCTETLAVIRPVMKQYKIRTSEWPPQVEPFSPAGGGHD